MKFKQFLKADNFFSKEKVVEIPQSELDALLKIYSETKGDLWIQNRNWLESNTPSIWFGVSVVNGHVVQLSLSANNLSGSIPPEIGNLTHLKELYLFNNKLAGSLPNQICNLTALLRLNLANNQFSGPIPENIGNLSQLEEFIQIGRAHV